MNKSTIIAISTLAALTASTHLLANNQGAFLNTGIGVQDSNPEAFGGIGVRKDTMEFGGVISARRIETDYTASFNGKSDTISGNETEFDIDGYFAKLNHMNGKWSLRYGAVVGYGYGDFSGTDGLDVKSYTLKGVLFAGPSVDIGESASLNISTDVASIEYNKLDVDHDPSSTLWDFMTGVNVELSYFF